MADKEYIDRGALLKEIDDSKPENWSDTEAELQAEWDYRAYRDMVAKRPAADVVEVVRCEGCKFYEKAEYDGGTKDVCRLFKRQMQPCDYCSYGKRKYR